MYIRNFVYTFCRIYKFDCVNQNFFCVFISRNEIFVYTKKRIYVLRYIQKAYIRRNVYTLFSCFYVVIYRDYRRLCF